MPIKINGTNTAANPSITGSDTDTGIVYGSDQIDFSTGGSSKVTLNGSNLGVGTNSPQKPLNILASGTELIRLSQAVDGSTQQEFGIGWAANNSHTHPSAKITTKEFDASDSRANLLFYTRGSNADSAPSERMRIDSSGNIGIGTTSPSNYNSDGNNLVVGGGAANTGITIASSSATGLGKLFFAREDPATGSNNRKGLIAYEHQNEALTFHTGVDERMRVTSDGQLLIGTTSANDTREMLRIKNTTGDGTFLTIEAPSDTGSCHIFFGDSDFNEGRISYLHSSNKMTFTTNDASRMEIDSSGNIGAPSGTNIYNASDQRVKKNIVTLDKGLTSINSLRPVSFNWIDGFCDAEKESLYGFIAQEVQSVDPNLISQFGLDGTVQIGEEKIENTLRVNEKFITPILVKAVQELSAKVTTLETENAKLQTDLTALTARVAALEAK